MVRSVRSRLTYANVVATLALFIALGGASYAAVKLPKNSVGGAQVRNGSLTGADVKDRSLTPADVRGSLQGPQGPQGPAGPAGAQGATGPAGSARAYGYVKSDGTLLASRSKNLTVTRIAVGYYCVRPAPGSGIDPATVQPVATPDFSDGNGTKHTVQSYSALEADLSCVNGWTFLTDDAATAGPGHFDVGFAVLVP